MVQLHFYGSVFDLDEDQSVADVFNLMNNFTREQSGQTWLKLKDGSTVHFQCDGQPSYAVVAPKGYHPEGLKVTQRYPSVPDEPFDPSEI